MRMLLLTLIMLAALAVNPAFGNPNHATQAVVIHMPTVLSMGLKPGLTQMAFANWDLPPSIWKAAVDLVIQSNSQSAVLQVEQAVPRHLGARRVVWLRSGAAREDPVERLGRQAPDMVMIDGPADGLKLRLPLEENWEGRTLYSLIAP